MTIRMDCPYEPPHTHDFPDDWDFGGANGADPRTDSRWATERRSTYYYLSEALDQLEVTQTPLCDDEAIDQFTKVRDHGPTFDPVYLQAVRPDGSTELVRWRYDSRTDEVVPF